MCARVRVVSYSDESWKGTRQPRLPVLVPCMVSPQLSYACQPPFAAEASLRAPRLSLWVLLAFLLPSLALRFLPSFTFTILHNAEDDPKISGSRDRNNEDDLYSCAPGPTRGRGRLGSHTMVPLKNLYTSVGLSPARPNT